MILRTSFDLNADFYTIEKQIREIIKKYKGKDDGEGASNSRRVLSFRFKSDKDAKTALKKIQTIGSEINARIE